MMDDTPNLLWTQAAWLEQVYGWIDVQLKSLGIHTTGAIEQPHIRPWSTVLRIPTSEGSVYFKANVPVFAHEAALTVALAEWCPDTTLQVLAADLQHRWLLMCDGGMTLRRLIQADGDLTHWHRVLPLYAGMQRTLAPHQAELLALGVPDRRLAVLPLLYRQLLAERDVLGVGQTDGLSTEEYRSLHALTPHVEQMCAELAAVGIAETLQHDDLHDNNILVNQGRYLIFDWGDSCVAHPFFTMLVTLRSAGRTLALPDNDPALRHLSDLYLRAWSGEFSLEDLHHAFGLAQRLGMLCRALTWYRLVGSLEGALRQEHQASVSGWLQEFLKVQALC